LLQIGPGESRVLRTTEGPSSGGAAWPYVRADASGSLPLTGAWQVHFVSGGPVLPADFTAAGPLPWTDRDDREAQRFAGTAVYRIGFEAPVVQADDWRLDLGRVGESARVRINGHDLGTVWCAPFSVTVGKWLHAGTNVLEVEVTNVAANRIADLDRRHVEWKRFYEINFVNVDYRPFDASDWPLRPSGLIGPVKLTPLRTEDAGP
jgi:hypothetical protein